MDKRSGLACRIKDHTVQDFGAEHGILTQAWSPIGGITFFRDGSRGSTLADPVIGKLPLPTARPPPR